MRSMFFNQGVNRRKVGTAINSKKLVTNSELLHARFAIILRKGMSCDKDACVCPKTKVLIRQVGYTPADVKEFCNGLGKYMKKEDGKILVDSKTNRAIVLDKYEKCFSKCITEFLGALINRHTGANYELPIAGWGVFNSLTIRGGIDATVTGADMGEVQRIRI